MIVSNLKIPLATFYIFNQAVGQKINSQRISSTPIHKWKMDQKRNQRNKCFQIDLKWYNVFRVIVSKQVKDLYDKIFKTFGKETE